MAVGRAYQLSREHLFKPMLEYTIKEIKEMKRYWWLTGLIEGLVLATVIFILFILAK